MAVGARTRYTRYSDAGEDFEIAYQIIGDGPVDLLVFTGAGVPVDAVDDEPSMARFHRRIAGYCRVIRFDHRGQGLSGRVSPSAEIGPGQWARDGAAVLDAVGLERAVIFGPGTSALSGIVFASRYPERTEKLILINGAARALWAADYDFGVDPSVVTPFLSIAVEADALEQGFDGLGIIAPTVARDDAFRQWWDRAGNRSATPSMATAISSAVAHADVRDLLPTITAPTLVMHRVANRFIDVRHGRYIADHITNSRYVELPGADTLYWVGDTSQLLAEVEEFITGTRSGAGTEREVMTILFTDIVGSTDTAGRLGDERWRDLLDAHDQATRRQLDRFGGREVNTVGDGFVAGFTSPSRAIDCAEAIVGAVSGLGIAVRAGLHCGEMEVRGADVAGVGVHIGARVSALAAAGQVLVSSTVRDLVTGSPRTFTDQGEHALKGVPGMWRVYSVDR